MMFIDELRNFHMKLDSFDEINGNEWSNESEKRKTSASSCRNSAANKLEWTIGNQASCY